MLLGAVKGKEAEAEEAMGEGVGCITRVSGPGQACMIDGCLSAFLGRAGHVSGKSMDTDA